jgi:hypothetical protein
LTEVLSGLSRFKEAGELLCQTGNYELSKAVDLFIKGNAFMQAIRESSKETDPNEEASL